MASFTYQAKNSKGKRIRGVIETASLEEARRDLQSRGYSELKLREKRGFRLPRPFQGVSKLDLALFCRQLSVLLHSGVAIRRSLQILSSQGFEPRFTQILRSVELDVSTGLSLSRAMNRHPRVFGPLYIGMVKAGESSGTLSEVLLRLAIYAENEIRLAQKIKAAITYPAVIFVLSLALATVIVQHILPTFINGVFASENLQLPLMTQVLVRITGFLNSPGVLATVGLIVAATLFALWQYFRTAYGRYQLHLLLHRTSGVKEVLRVVLASRFCRIFSALLKSGIPLVHALDLANNALGDYVVSARLERAQMDIREGSGMALAVRAMDVFPPMLVEFLAVGEETGRIPELLDKLGDVYDEDIDNAIDCYAKLLEPIMLAVMGSIVGFVVIAVFLPLYQLVETL